MLIWQDYAIIAIQVGFILALLPMLLGPGKPDRRSCAFTAVLLYALAAVVFTLGARFGALLMAGSGLCWTILLLQRRN